jgi:hypothetical protein
MSLTNLALFSLHGAAASAGGAPRQICQSQKILDSERRAATGYSDEGIGRIHVSEARRNAPQLAIISEEEHSILGPVVLANDQIELPASQRMERMDHPHPLLRIPPIGRNRRFSPSLASSGPCPMCETTSSPARPSSIWPT